jgi:segregation and condensation protein B
MEETDQVLEADHETAPDPGAEDQIAQAAEQQQAALDSFVEEEEPDTGEEVTTADEDIVVAEAFTEGSSQADSVVALKAVIEAAIYITDEPLAAEQIASALEQPLDKVKEILAVLVTEYAAPDRGLSIRELAGGYKMATKPEHHEAIRRFVNKLQPMFKLSLAALETLAVVAYKQPITAPEILEVRGVQGAGVLKTLLDRKLIAAAGRKNVVGKPILYKTTREFLIQFGLNSLAELPTLKEFEELGRFALSEGGESTREDQEQTPPAANQEQVEAPAQSELSLEQSHESQAAESQAAESEQPSATLQDEHA